MNVIRIRHVDEFNGADVVLLAADGAGLGTFLAALIEAQQRGSSRLQRHRRVHDFVIETGAADIALGDDRVVWRLDHAKAAEIVEKLQVLAGSGRRAITTSTTCRVRRQRWCYRATSTCRRAG